MLSLQQRSAETLLQQFHPNSADEAIRTLRKSGYPREIVDVVRARAPINVLTTMGKGMYHLIDRDGKKIPLARLVFHGHDPAARRQLSSIEVKRGSKWVLELLSVTHPKSVFEKVRTRFPNVAVVHYQGAVPEPYLLLDGTKIKLLEIRTHSFELQSSKRTFREQELLGLPVFLVFHGYKMRLRQNGPIGVNYSPAVSGVGFDLVFGRFKVSLQFKRTQTRFQLDYGFVHVLTAKELQTASSEADDDFYGWEM